MISMRPLQTWHHGLSRIISETTTSSSKDKASSSRGRPLEKVTSTLKRAYEIFKTKSVMRRINIETEMEIPLDDMNQALQMEKETIERSII
jgi:hypothetical protein